MMDERQTSGTGEEESTGPVTPAQPSDSHGEEQTEADDEIDIPAVLPSHDGVLAKVANVRNTDLVTGLEDHPAHVCPPETAVCVVGVELGVGVSVVSTVSARPPLNRAFDGAGSSHGQKVLEGQGCIVRTMRP